jgi:DNA-binding winged helix-turn-helix (wHTH) protein
VQINRLRRKIERDPANPVWLQTVRGVGYRLSSRVVPLRRLAFQRTSSQRRVRRMAALTSPTIE